MCMNLEQKIYVQIYSLYTAEYQICICIYIVLESRGATFPVNLLKFPVIFPNLWTVSEMNGRFATLLEREAIIRDGE